MNKSVYSNVFFRMPRTGPKAVVKTPGKLHKSIAEWSGYVLVLLFATTAIAQPYVIPTGSMQNTLLVGDHVLVDKLAYSPAGGLARHLLPFDEPKHGDVIVFRYPPDISQTLVKRLIGAPGDHIRITQGAVYRNGIRLYEPYVIHQPGYVAALDNFPGACCLPVAQPEARERQREMLERNVVNGELIVPPGMYFAMGDNRDDSSDSRYWGFVPRDSLMGKPFLVYWSYDASTQDLMGQSAGSVIAHAIDLGEHFFTRTRWSRTLRVVRGVPDDVTERAN
ncbi:MAG TPA: signal peptidase I [Bryobacteraceae bacterium]|nr:signal peptidase I [Bryobacteraceae bacterium]